MDVLKKLKINYEELNAEEKKTYEQWSEAYDAKPITINGLKEHLEREIQLAEYEMTDFNNEPVKDLYLKMKIRNLKMMLAFISSPEKKREAVKAEIEKKFNIKL